MRSTPPASVDGSAGSVHSLRLQAILEQPRALAAGRVAGADATPLPLAGAGAGSGGGGGGGGGGSGGDGGGGYGVGGGAVPAGAVGGWTGGGAPVAPLAHQGARRQSAQSTSPGASAAMAISHILPVRLRGWG